mmetsp:Transcript_11187/g.24647  ORF Transcript_11187/g.24647 Transcript_11187/m.24647 type:complete len:85 (-) Transcript_11187:162-416(-)
MELRLKSIWEPTSPLALETTATVTTARERKLIRLAVWHGEARQVSALHSYSLTLTLPLEISLAVVGLHRSQSQTKIIKPMPSPT